MVLVLLLLNLISRACLSSDDNYRNMPYLIALIACQFVMICSRFPEVVFIIFLRRGQVQVHLRDLLAGGVSGVNVSYPVKTSSGEIGGEIILSHTISCGENGIDMETNKTEKEGQFAMDVIKGVATVVATVVVEVAIEAAQVVFS
ncbi:hypothetical protein Tco_0096958 [Tanacetum coccineum]